MTCCVSVLALAVAGSPAGSEIVEAVAANVVGSTVWDSALVAGRSVVAVLDDACCSVCFDRVRDLRGAVPEVMASRADCATADNGFCW